MQIPIHFGQLAIFGDDVAHRTIGEAAAAPVNEHRFHFRFGGGFQNFLANRPVFVEGGLRFRAVRHHAFFAAFPQHAQHLPGFVHVAEAETDQLADP